MAACFARESPSSSSILVSATFIEDATAEWGVCGGHAATAGEISNGATLYDCAYPGARIRSTDTRQDCGERVGSVGWRWLSLKH